jgi:hypothetical protein
MRIGIAADPIAQKWLANQYNQPEFNILDYRIYAVCGDDCMMEGDASEAASLVRRGFIGVRPWSSRSLGGCRRFSPSGAREATFAQHLVFFLSPLAFLPGNLAIACVDRHR